MALTRARKICIIFGPLDMKGFIGAAATVMGSLMYGTGHCWQGRINVHLRHPELDKCPTDETFVESLSHNSERVFQPYPPVAIAESVSDAVLKRYKIRRLHLVIVDLWRPWKVNQKQVKSLTNLMGHLEPSDFTVGNTPMMQYGANSPLHCRRFVYGYSIDGSDFPCYFLWPHRTQQNSFWLLESQTHRHIDISLATFLKPLGLQHFYDAFGINAALSIRAAALEVFHLQEGDLSNDLLVSADAARARGWTDHMEQPIDQIRMHQRLTSAMYQVMSSALMQVKWTASRQQGRTVVMAMMMTLLVPVIVPAASLLVRSF